jgi:hypothetical protein
MQKKTGKITGIVFLLIVLSIPYLMHPSQDLPVPVTCEEAALHLDAKDSVLFGTSPLKGEPGQPFSSFIHTVLSLIPFYFMGVSLLSLRFPYILLNCVGNILFFDFVRRTKGTFMAVITTVLYTLYAPRLMVGKSAMPEALLMPLLLILIWLFLELRQKSFRYFWIGMLGMCIVITQRGAFIFFIPLSILVSWECLRYIRSGERKKAARVSFLYLFGAVSVGIALLVVSFFSGGKLGGGLMPLVQEQLFKDSPGMGMIFLLNTRQFYHWYPGYLMVLVFSLPFFLSLAVFSREERDNPLSRVVLFLLVCLVGEMSLKPNLPAAGFAPFFPLVFLIITSLFGFSLNALRTRFQESEDKGGEPKQMQGIYLAAACLPILLSWSIVQFTIYQPGILSITRAILFQPSYRDKREARYMSSLIRKQSKVLFLDNCFSSIALLLRNKCLFLSPHWGFSSGANEVSSISQMLSSDREIAYVFVKYDNLEIRKMLVEKFKAQFEEEVMQGQGVLYFIPPA